MNSSIGTNKNNEIYARILRVLENGIRIGERHYKFLAFGNSQLRENGAFFFCETQHITCDDIRKWMGDFSTIKTVAKYAARIGQCFSTTRLIPGFSVPTVVKIKDVERGGFCFTDGVGKISSLWAHLIANHLRIDTVPSAFQFRMGGCKGVLTVWPDAKLGEVHIRPSQEKFTKAIFNGLEIIRYSKYSAATLNQQTISILSTLRVGDHVFMDLLRKDMANLNGAMKNKDKAVRELVKRVDENQTTLTVARMVLNGFMEANEPFLCTLLQLWRSWSIKALKQKARITVEEGAFVLGCVDETGKLRGHSDGSESFLLDRGDPDLLPQIFLQVPNGRDHGKYKVVTGLCLVGRNPSLHPGDIRVVEAVEVEELLHLKDVVVFPQTGDRDVPSMCSGGDLDGDDFFVIWNKDLLPNPMQWNYTPMDYTAPKPPTSDSEITLKDLSSFFVTYMKNDTLPTIALAHRAHADFQNEKAKDPKCKETLNHHARIFQVSLLTNREHQVWNLRDFTRRLSISSRLGSPRRCPGP